MLLLRIRRQIKVADECVGLCVHPSEDNQWSDHNGSPLDKIYRNHSQDSQNGEIIGNSISTTIL